MKLLMVSLFLIVAQSAFAGESLYNGIYRGFESTRANGMGNAFLAIANDNTAILYNPAGLVNLKEGEMNLFLKGGVDSDFVDLFTELDTARGDSGNTSDAQDIVDLLKSKYNTAYSLRAPSFGGLYARPNWGIAVIPLDLSIDMSIHRTIGPSINLVAYNDFTVAYAHAWEVFKNRFGKLSVGVTPKAIYRFNIDKIVDATQIQADNVIRPEDAREGLTADVDVGLLWTLPEKKSGFLKYFAPSFAFVARNLADVGYFTNLNLVGEASGDPEKLIRRFDLGMAAKLPSWWVFSSNLAFDVRDLGHPKWTFQKGYHLGLEFNWQVTSWWKGGWRVGLNQGYWTAGFSGELAFFKLEVATYAEELGTSSVQIENRRYQLTMSFDF